MSSVQIESRHLDEEGGSVKFDTKGEDYLAAEVQAEDHVQRLQTLTGVQQIIGFDGT